MAGEDKTLKGWAASGTPWIWLTAGTVSFSLLMVVGIVALITFRGLGHFWPQDVGQIDGIGRDGTTIQALGEIVDSETVTPARLEALGIKVKGDRELIDRYLLKVGNRDVYGIDFRWFSDTEIGQVTYPQDVLVAERREWGNFYGFPVGIQTSDPSFGVGRDLKGEINSRLERALQLREQIEEIEKNAMGDVNFEMESLRLAARRLELEGIVAAHPRSQQIAAQRKDLHTQYEQLSKRLGELYSSIERDVLLVRTVDDQKATIKFSDLVRVFYPNQMDWASKMSHYFAKIGEFVLTEPREANTEGGVFPAIFGTILMVMLMSVIVTPFGVIAAIYLREYAHQGSLTRAIRIAVNNLAGVPSVVYGVFGLGFFVYFTGGTIDQLFFPEALPAPTFGTPGLLWSSLTLALLTVPVVIVSTEEGLARIPRSIREGSLALGATKAETLWKTVLPMATPAMMTGRILAVARAAGEVAPLMMVGVVKLAPSLPFDGNFPFLHVDRKFMHLGFHIYDVGFQSPNVEAARPLVYATSLLLIIIIVALNLAAIMIRNRLREKYNATDT